MLSSKIDISQIITDHLKTLRNDNVVSSAENDSVWKDIPPSDRRTFIYFPIIVGCILGFSYPLTRELINVYATMMSIFAGFLFNLLVLCIDRQKTIQERKNIPNVVPDMIDKALKSLSELFSNISFMILLSVLILLLVLLVFFIPVNVNNFCLTGVQIGLSWTVYSLFIIFVLTLLMVLKRTYIITQLFVF